MSNKFKNYKYTHKKDDKSKKTSRKSTNRRSSNGKIDVAKSSWRISQQSHSRKNDAVKNTGQIVHKKRSILPNINTVQHPNDKKNQRKSVQRQSSVRKSVEQPTGQNCNEAQTSKRHSIARNAKRQPNDKNSNEIENLMPSNRTVDQDLDELKTLIVNKTNMQIVKSKLISTAAKRFSLVKNKLADFLEHFPIFFTNPELVSN